HGLLAVNERTALFFHPLLHDLLVRQFTQMPQETRQAVLDKCQRLLEHRLWEEALSVGERSLDAEFIAESLGVALDDLMAAGSTSRRDRWVTAARRAEVDGGLIDYAEAELQLRQGGFERSIALGGFAGRTLGGDLAARAHLVAARSAHLARRTKMRDNHLS